jgi:hypothetical protein
MPARHHVESWPGMPWNPHPKLCLLAKNLQLLLLVAGKLKED